MKSMFIKIFSILLVSSCSVLTTIKCNTTDWIEYGEDLGSKGSFLLTDSKINSCFNTEKEKSSSEYSDLLNSHKNGVTKYCSSKVKNWFEFALSLQKKNQTLESNHTFSLCNDYGLADASQAKEGYTKGERDSCHNFNNWEIYSARVGMSGLDLNNDTFYSNCVSIEAKFAKKKAIKGYMRGLKSYCSPSTAKYKGENDEDYDTSICQSKLKMSTTNIDSSYLSGLKLYCTEEQGFEDGSNRNSTSRNCIVHFRDQYFTGNQKGKISFIDKKIFSIKNEILSIIKEIHSSKEDLLKARKKLTYFVPELESTTKNVYDSEKNKYVLVNVQEETYLSRRKREYLEEDVNEYKEKISKLKKTIIDRESEINELEMEKSSIYY